MSGPKEFDLWVDFNDIRDGRLTTLREHAWTKAGTSIGCVVVVGDDDGTRALARVEGVRDGMIVAVLLKPLPPAAPSPGDGSDG